MEVPTIESVLQGVYVLYNDTNTVEQQKASKWLEEVQKSVYSWQIADQLLHQKYDLHSCCFAAQTIRNKIQNSFHELPDESHVSLRDSLMVHLSQITIETSPIIVTQLCLAIADLSLLMSKWKDPIRDLIHQLSQNEQNVWPLINILSLLPEELYSQSLRLGLNRRDEFNEQMVANSKIVHELLLASLTNYAGGNPTKILAVIKCFSSWIYIYANDISDVTNNVIVAAAFNVLNNLESDQKLNDAACELLCSLLENISIEKYPDEAKSLMNCIVQLETSYHLSVQREESEKIMNFCDIFTTLAESFLYEMIDIGFGQKPHYSIKSIDLILMCIGHHNYQVAEITFTFWHRLIEKLYENHNDEISYHFQSYIERLLFNLYRLCQMKPEQQGLLNENDNLKVSFSQIFFYFSFLMKKFKFHSKNLQFPFNN